MIVINKTNKKSEASLSAKPLAGPKFLLLKLFASESTAHAHSQLARWCWFSWQGALHIRAPYKSTRCSPPLQSNSSAWEKTIPPGYLSLGPQQKRKKKWYKFDSTERILLIYKLPLFSQKDNKRRKRKGTKGILARNTEHDTWKAVGNKKLPSFCWGWRYLEDLMEHQNFFTMKF